MAGTTTNNGWDYPTSTDYVKDGALAIQTLATDIDTSTGTGLVAWQSWTPTLSLGWANGNGTWTAKYAQLGKNVIATGYFVVGSTTTKGSGLHVSLPVTAANANNVNAYGWCATTSSTGFAALGAIPNTTTTIQLTSVNTAGTYAALATLTSTAPITWATGSVLSFTAIYEAA
jgi:hypothetical protein